MTLPEEIFKNSFYSRLPRLVSLQCSKGARPAVAFLQCKGNWERDELCKKYSSSSLDVEIFLAYRKAKRLGKTLVSCAIGTFVALPAIS